MRGFTRQTVRRLAVALGAMTLVAFGVTLAADAPSTASAQGATAAVSIVDFAFNPPSVTVPVGGRVTWTNTGQAPHTSTSTSGGWDSGRLTPGQTFTFTATQAGTFNYMCTIHPTMLGAVVVQGAATAPAAAPAAGAQAAPTAALPRTGTGGILAGDSANVLPAIVAGLVLLVGITGWAYRQRRT